MFVYINTYIILTLIVNLSYTALLPNKFVITILIFKFINY